MDKIRKLCVLMLVILFSWSIVAIDGEAANSKVTNAKTIKFDKDGYFNIKGKFTENDKLKKNTYGKYYKVVVPIDGEISIPSGKNVTLYTKDLKKARKANKERAYYLYERVKAGTYYIYVESKSKSEINISGRFFKIFYETESNNTLKKANDITKYLSVNYVVPNLIGSFKDKKDIDIYKFKVPYDKTEVNFGFGHNEFPKSSILLLDGKGKSIEYLYEDGGQVVTYLPKGTYYLKLKSNTTVPYGKKYYVHTRTSTTKYLGVTKAIKASNVSVTNNYNKTKDVIKLKNLTKGWTYTIYKDKTMKTKITSFKAEGKSKTIKVNQLGAKKGAIYVTTKKPKYHESNVTKVTYKAEKTPSPSSK